MGFLSRAIRDGISDAVSKAIGDGIRDAVEPKATELMNKAAQSIDSATQQTEERVYRESGLEGAAFNLRNSMESYATERAKNIKICPSCDEPCSADKKFCPHCGAKLPETTVAEGAVCPNCGKQNTVGTKFCSDCGTKLPAAVAEEQAQANRDATVMAEWDEKLSNYPKWCCGGSDFCINEYDEGYLAFIPNFFGENNKAHIAVREYREVLLQNGFKQAGQYPNIEHLYKKVDGVCYHVDTEHCFDGDPDCPTIAFDTQEPLGGYDYVKPEPKKQVGLKDLKDLFKF